MSGNVYKKVAAGQTTAQISTPSDGIRGNDYLERVIITCATTAVGAVSVFDGTTSLLVHNALVTGNLGTNVYTYELGVLCDSTKGFNVTTGASVSVVCIGRF
jgi:hypothetical protein